MLQRMKSSLISLGPAFESIREAILEVFTLKLSQSLFLGPLPAVVRRTVEKASVTPALTNSLKTNLI